MQDLSKISVVLPSLDPDEKLNAVIDGLLEYGFSNIILVNDGSKQENLHYFTDAAAGRRMRRYSRRWRRWAARCWRTNRTGGRARL